MHGRCVKPINRLSTFAKEVMKQTRKQFSRDYDACIETLNNLQSNAQYIKNASTKSSPFHNPRSLKDVQTYLERAGLEMEQLDRLPVIHVTGTKGKGSTCAYSERILREHGLKTGFYSSPHLIEVRERIRINGRPISKQEFSRCFWSVYASLDEKKKSVEDMPIYFRFLTIMAFKIFIEQQVDVAIVEVGIGGEYDCTNVLRKVAVAGITSLGIDHVSLLGPSIESIAWNKAGIMKENCRAFTVPQPKAAMEVLQRRSVEKQCTLDVVPGLHFKNAQANVLSVNAGLAVAMCDAFLSSRQHPTVNCLDKELTQKALDDTRWPGRFQRKHLNNVTYYLDGAHTLDSVRVCAHWFQQQSHDHPKILMFNVTGDREAPKLLQVLGECDFDTVLFVTNVAREDSSHDNVYFQSIDVLVRKCEQHRALWLTLGKTKHVHVFRTVNEALDFLEKQVSVVDVLVTGSLHLVGAVLSLIEPEDVTL